MKRPSLVVAAAPRARRWRWPQRPLGRPQQRHAARRRVVVRPPGPVAQGLPSARASGRPLGESWGDDFTRDCQAQRGARPRRCAHAASETTPRVVGVVNPGASLWATTGRCHGRWGGRQLAMAPETRHNRRLGNGGNEPERATSTQRTGRQTWRDCVGALPSAHTVAEDRSPSPGQRCGLAAWGQRAQR
jgi:hypothetical protein